jgi:hypothetical protein
MTALPPISSRYFLPTVHLNCLTVALLIQAAQCASDEEMEGDELFEDKENDSHPKAMSDADSSISNVEGSDPEDETAMQAEAIVNGLRDLARDETRKKYRGGMKLYKVTLSIRIAQLSNQSRVSVCNPLRVTWAMHVDCKAEHNLLLLNE